LRSALHFSRFFVYEKKQRQERLLTAQRLRVKREARILPIGSVLLGPN